MDASDWETMHLPATWESAGHEGFDGVAWFRKTFDLPSELFELYASEGVLSPERAIELKVEAALTAQADPHLMTIVLGFGGQAALEGSLTGGDAWRLSAEGFQAPEEAVSRDQLLGPEPPAPHSVSLIAWHAARLLPADRLPADLLVNTLERNNLLLVQGCSSSLLHDHRG